MTGTGTISENSEETKTGKYINPFTPFGNVPIVRAVPFELGWSSKLALNGGTYEEKKTGDNNNNLTDDWPDASTIGWIHYDSEEMKLNLLGDELFESVSLD
jgi:hypothetical protein